MDLLSDKVLAVIPTDDPSPVAFLNLYEPNDIWVKVQDCSVCKPEDQAVCCGNCPQRMTKGCEWHFEPGKHKAKPFHCCIVPIPSTCMSRCSLVYKCVSGRWKDYQRHVSDTRGVLRKGDCKVSA